MGEHERNLYDLYAGMAMMGMLAHKGNDLNELHTLTHQAFGIADMMLLAREEILEDKRQDEIERRRHVPDVAVPDMEGREDSSAQGIAALKKPRTRTKSV